MRISPPSTLADVARAAGVGIATASRVVNGGDHVSAASRKKVEAAVRKLGYLPNHAARILKGGRTKTIGLLVPSIADSFFALCAEAAELVAREHDSSLIIAVSDNDPTLEMKNLTVLMRHRPDGLLLVPSDPASTTLLQFVKDSHIPIVTLDRPLPNCPAVLTDSWEASREATLHLIEHRRRHILCLGAEPGLYTIQERLRGYRDAMKKAKLPPRIDLTLGDRGNTAEEILATQMRLASPPDAIFSLKNSATIAAFQALQHLKLSIPADVALIGFDDFELAGTLRPPLTVVRQPIEDIGKRAAEMLFSMLQPMSGKLRRPSTGRLILESQLIIRRSCGCTR